MALRCISCGKGIARGNAVSHAKNRTKRLFKPNIQKIKVESAGQKISVRMCTDCIQRLKKDRRLGKYRMIVYGRKDKEIKEALANLPKVEETVKETAEKAEKKKKETLDIESIVGKK